MGERGQILRGAVPLPQMGVHYFELRFYPPVGKESGNLGGHAGYCNNVTMGVISDVVPESVYHMCGTGSEPALHYKTADRNPDGGWWGMTECGNAYRDGVRTGDGNYKLFGHAKTVGNGEPVGIL